VITRTVRIQLMVFLLITVIGVAFVGARYAQIDKLLFDEDYTVNASFAESGGIFSGAEVTYRGQPVGKVGDLKLLSSGRHTLHTRHQLTGRRVRRLRRSASHKPDQGYDHTAHETTLFHRRASSRPRAPSIRRGGHLHCDP